MDWYLSRFFPAFDLYCTLFGVVEVTLCQTRRKGRLSGIRPPPVQVNLDEHLPQHCFATLRSRRRVECTPLDGIERVRRGEKKGERGEKNGRRWAKKPTFIVCMGISSSHTRISTPTAPTHPSSVTASKCRAPPNGKRDTYPCKQTTHSKTCSRSNFQLTGSVGIKLVLGLCKKDKSKDQSDCTQTA